MVIVTFRLNFSCIHAEDTGIVKMFSCDPDSQSCVLRVGHLKILIRNTLVNA